MEKGHNAEKEHIQFAIKFDNARSFKSVQKLFEGAHIEVAKNWIACINYCKKDDTALGDRIDNINQKKCKDPLENKVKNPMQNEVINIINDIPDDRTIHWFYDEEGGQGKTTLAKHLCLSRNDILYLTGKSADMKYGIFNWLKKHKLHCVIMDFTRSTEGYVSYQGIEEIKNGIFYNTKYESEMCIFDNPHVIIFANFKPDLTALSFDRWHVVNCVDFMNVEVNGKDEIEG